MIVLQTRSLRQQIVRLRTHCWAIEADELWVVVKLVQELPHMHFSSVEFISRFCQNAHQLFTVKTVLVNSGVLARLLTFPPPSFMGIASSFLLLLMQPLVLLRMQFLLLWTALPRIQNLVHAHLLHIWGSVHVHLTWLVWTKIVIVFES